MLHTLERMPNIHSFPLSLMYTHNTRVQCREICMEVQDHFLKELRDLGEVGQHTSVLII